MFSASSQWLAILRARNKALEGAGVRITNRALGLGVAQVQELGAGLWKGLGIGRALGLEIGLLKGLGLCL